MSAAEPPAGGRAAVRLLQGYLWYPEGADVDLESFLPRELDLSQAPSLSEEDAHVLWDQVQPPFAFFENGEPTASQTFYQFTVLRVYDERPSNEELHDDATIASQALNPLLEGTPQGVGWQIWEDLRDL
ncbi:DUF3208 domain-containing protein [Deinococcus radiodurans]|uniref:DUF3208 domain-containing protein n=1 Tax=Deinococcus radiodurans (strain ATCC 13939 / DSM 20539 / JCM 16871 / CCUG 27074 / LMG 4051 / NBRC 15346 / NCIMB 9279 / VKM B-1422 / R1) TaxID=243230 RepID=Q9RSG8_DEIRA|nr:DUF3208 domain-containing protein [Deinococcus radiodurans]AAF11710.1 hypothetical protein DR_2156 [Deinococcus radiodurans R1 = ATCC 13939 = DSM 20539]ANC70783.1 hypothetical protein A2G07_02830 [Deinococcus radiodurans R1 = ATCC 13939 = DSM 20539]QEM71541.1 DUF3208 domain-containing protein [Deinococcus radiodurans]QIP27860.1 DUF3208 family protein [Deinococcus radiodurans]QIP31260.1 DUF3208 family protein [Deinococcus radiodurans]